MGKSTSSCTSSKQEIVAGIVTDAYVADSKGVGMLLPKMQGIKEVIAEGRTIVHLVEKPYNIKVLVPSASL